MSTMPDHAGLQAVPATTDLLVFVQNPNLPKELLAATIPNTTELSILDGATVSTEELNQYAVEVVIPDISAAQSVFVVCPHAGDIAKIYSVIDNAITVGDATITAEIGGTLVTGSAITIAFSGSAAGDVDSSTPSAANTVTAGQAVEIITDGGSTDACRATVTLLITR